MTRTNHTIIRKLAALGAAALLLSATACSAHGNASANTDTNTMRVAYLSTANYLTTLKNEQFAQDELAPATVKFTGPYNPADARTAVQSGNADATSTGTGSFINLIAQDQPWVAFAIEYYDGDSQGIVAAPGTGIDSLKDLYGKTIAIDSKGATGDYIVHQAFANAGLDASQVTEVEMSPSNFSAAFSSGQVDAIATFDQNLASAMVTPGAKLLVNAEDYGNLNVSIHIVSQSFADEHPDLVKAMYRALVKESDKAQEHPEIITDAYREFGASDEIVDQVAKFDVPEILPIDADGLDMLEQQAQQYVDFGFIDALPDVKSHVMDCTR
ncbi:ABC transporter substrate-binding protein [Bifidobacterium pullorum]|uniref:ABC transporter substrate-binding protein n=1 Tax=Bifidobacterium pullorum TaxID=78448 RepID=UPI0024ACD47E|nr:NrtA/SsuA/CpmA family ABC transporter substrate-binding protein [Bifidobacterium pullorum]